MLHKSTQCVEALETSVALLVKQNTMLEEQRIQQNTYRKELGRSGKELQEFQEKLEQELKNIKNRQEMIKSRQEIFTKQDQIQSTLHGETHSPSTSVLVNMSPPFTSPTTSVINFEASSKVDVHLPSQMETTGVSSILSESDLESMFSLDWITPLESQAEGAQTGAEVRETPHLRTASPLVEATTTRASRQPMFGTIPILNPLLELHTFMLEL